MAINDETLVQFITRRVEDTRAFALAARTTIASVPENQLVSADLIERLVGADAIYAEWVTLQTIAEGRAPIGEPDEVLQVHLVGYLQERILAFSLTHSTSVIYNEVNDVRLGALQSVLRAVR